MTYQDIVEKLLADVGASRTTIRLDRPDAVFPVVAEATAPGINSIAGATSIDLKAAPTFIFLAEQKRPLIQSDLLNTDVPPPPALIELYGARAQMVAPILRDDELVGMVSVHYAPGVRDWTSEEIAALEQAVEQVQAQLD
jgi:GAF domain-containing protein